MNDERTKRLAAFAINGQSVDHKTFTDAACDPRRSIAVEACAGAGKTWMLIERMIRALQAGAEPDEILAITFTKKAAGEMRGRLQERLAMPELATLRAQMLASGRSVQISNFHAWFAQLLKAAPLSAFKALNLPMVYELLLDEAVLVPELQHAFYAEAVASPALKADLAALFEDFGRSQVESSLASVLAKRTEFLLTDAQGLLEASVQSAAKAYPDFLDTSLRANLNSYKELGLTAKMLGAYDGKKTHKAASELEAALTADDAQAAMLALLTDKNAPRALALKAMSDADIAGLERSQAYLLAIQSAQHQHACWLYQQRMVRVGRAYLDCFAKIKHRRGLVDMADLERAAMWLLSDPERSGAAQERLDQKLRHVMIDEFQDTSPLQWQALHAWLSAYAGSGGGQSRPSLFIVGDPKQSIYRFRNAEPRVFAAAQVFMQETFDAALLTCDHTRRCATRVVDVVNAAMQSAEVNGEYAGFRLHTTEQDVAGAALCLPLIEPAEADDASLAPDWRDSLTAPRVDEGESLKEREVDQAARWIAANAIGQSVLVLSRTHEPLGLIQQSLQRYGVQASKQSKNDLADVPAVQDLLALLHFLISPQSDLDLARVLKSPLFAWTDEQLMQLRRLQLAALPDKKSWFELMTGSQKDKLTLWQAWLHRLPPHDALQAIYDDGDVLNRYLSAMPSAIRLSSHTALQALLWAALQVEGGRFLSAYAFVRAMRAKVQTIKAPAIADTLGASAGVQLLTVHGAKGLEADVVLLLSSDPQKQKKKNMTTLIDWQPEQPCPQRFVFLLSEKNPPHCSQSLLAEDVKARDLEELNALYVSVTRAKQTLVVSGSKAHHLNPKSVWHRLQALCLPAVVNSQTITKPTQIELPVAVAMLPVTAFTLPTTIGASLPNDSNPAAQQGKALHRLLQWQTVDMTALLAVASEFSLTKAQAAAAQARAQAILGGEAAWIWDAAVIDWQANEYEFIYQGKVLRIDRLVKRRDTQQWWVIDFKSALEPEKFLELNEQLETYRLAIADLLTVSTNLVKVTFVTGDGRLAFGSNKL